MAWTNEPDAPTAQPSPGVVRGVVLLTLGAGLLWLILTRSLPASLAHSSPETALSLQPNEPTALLTLAKTQFNVFLKSSETKPTDTASAGLARPDPLDRPVPDRLAALSRMVEEVLRSQTPAPRDNTLQQEQPSQESSEGRRPPPETDKTHPIRLLAERSLAADPLNADALRLLGQLAERAGDPSRTEALMRAAARVSIRESYAVYWLLQEAQRDNDRATVLRQADALLRTRGRAAPLVVPALVQVAEQGAASEVSALLATNPPWRPVFFGRLTQSITDARTPLYLLLDLQGTEHPPTQKELSSYINFLIGKGLHELAYYTWLQFLPSSELAGITPLFNPNFEKPLSGLPFDWSLAQGSGATSEIRPRPDPAADQDNAQALFVEFTQGRAEFAGVTQTTLLGPGTYTLSGKFKGTVIGTRGLVWRVICVGKGPLAATDLLRGENTKWRDFSLTVTIPPEGCRAQQVRLDLDARSASEKLVTGSMWFDELDLKRQPN